MHCKLVFDLCRHNYDVVSASLILMSCVTVGHRTMYSVIRVNVIIHRTMYSVIRVNVIIHRTM